MPSRRPEGAPTTTINSMAAGARRTMRAILVAAVLVLGMAGHSGAAGAGAPLPEVAVELLAAGFSAPVFLVAPDDGSGRRFVGEQAGVIYVVTAAWRAPRDAVSRSARSHGDLARGIRRAGAAWPGFPPGLRDERAVLRQLQRQASPWVAVHGRHGLHPAALGIPRPGLGSEPCRSRLGAHPPPTRLGQPQAQWRRARLRARWLPLPRAR